MYVEEMISKASLNNNKSVVCIDVNKRDIVYAEKFNSNGKLIKFRYTSNQRQKELKTKKYNCIRKKHEFGLHVQQLESQKTINKKTIRVNNFRNYILKCEIINKQLRPQYKNVIYRKLKWFSFLNKKKSETNMTKNFKKNLEVIKIL